MTINLDELRKTVENAGEAWADGEHIDIITPAVVRELIEEIESLRTRFKGMRASRDSERSRADKNAHKLEQAEQAVARVREAHKPKRIIEYNVPVFDEFDSPTVTHNGCTCGSHYYPCPTIRALDGEPHE